MKTNVGKTDRIIRIILGLGLIYLGTRWSWIFILLGIIVLLTGIFGYCWLYSLLKISTCKSCQIKK